MGLRPWESSSLGLKNVLFWTVIPQSNHLQKHYEKSHTIQERINLAEKSFQCQFCSRSFKHKSILDRHELIHTNEKPFQCNTCEKSFKAARVLKLHERIHIDHTGEKLFECKVCRKSFILDRMLKSHLRNVHNEII